jgi:hypothetical protein
MTVRYACMFGGACNRYKATGPIDLEYHLYREHRISGTIYAEHLGTFTVLGKRYRLQDMERAAQPHTSIKGVWPIDEREGREL